MKRFLLKIFCFSIPFWVWAIFSITTLPSLLEKRNGPNTQTQIDQSFSLAKQKEFELLILGNSRFYRGINPDLFTTPAFNFSHDNDTYNQLYYKLLYLLSRGKKINYMALSVDYFQFSFVSDTRNYAYADYLGNQYLNDYPSPPFVNKLYYHIENISLKKLLLLKDLDEKPYLKHNGQFIKPGKASKTDKRPSVLKYLPIQLTYFEKILGLCKKHQIKVFLIMMPVRDNEMANYSEQACSEFNKKILSYCQKYDCEYWNFDRNKEFTVEDYTDITHLNAKAADRFTILLNKKITQKLQNYRP
jgi:hypothetical protein